MELAIRRRPPNGRQCLLARRLVENGVRFVQLLHRGQPWDTHVRNDKETQNVCRKTQTGQRLLYLPTSSDGACWKILW